jgi:hypothetical protein
MWRSPSLVVEASLSQMDPGAQGLMGSDLIACRQILLMFDHDPGVCGVVGLLGEDPKGVCLCVGISRNSHELKSLCSVLPSAIRSDFRLSLNPNVVGCWHVRVNEEATIQAGVGGSQAALTRLFWPNDSPVLVSWPPPSTLPGWNHVGNSITCV